MPRPSSPLPPLAGRRRRARGWPGRARPMHRAGRAGRQAPCGRRMTSLKDVVERRVLPFYMLRERTDTVPCSLPRQKEEKWEGAVRRGVVRGAAVSVSPLSRRFTTRRLNLRESVPVGIHSVFTSFCAGSAKDGSMDPLAKRRMAQERGLRVCARKRETTPRAMWGVRCVALDPFPPIITAPRVDSRFSLTATKHTHTHTHTHARARAHTHAPLSLILIDWTNAVDQHGAMHPPLPLRPAV